MLYIDLKKKNHQTDLPWSTFSFWFLLHLDLSLIVVKKEKKKRELYLPHNQEYHFFYHEQESLSLLWCPKERLHSQNYSSSRGLTNVNVLSRHERIPSKSEYGKNLLFGMILGHLFKAFSSQLADANTNTSNTAFSRRTLALIVVHSLKSWQLLVRTAALLRHIKDKISNGGKSAKDLCETTLSLWMGLWRGV